MQIGLSKVDITPDFQVELKGQEYRRLSTGIESNIFASVAVIENVCIISIDACAAEKRLEQRLIRKKRQYNFSDIIICATHNHAAPKYDEIYLDLVATRLGTAIDDAVTNKATSKIAYGYESATTSKVRRKKYLITDERVTSGYNKQEFIHLYGGIKDFVILTDSFAGLDGDTDCIVNTMFIFDENDTLKGIIADVPCTAQCLEHSTVISADYWGNVRTKVQERFGNDVIVIPMCGVAGETGTRDNVFMLNTAERLKKKFDVQFDSLKAIQTRASQDRHNNALAIKEDIAQQVFNAIVNSYSWAQNEKLDNVTVEYEVKNVNIDNNVSNEGDIADIQQIITDIEKKIENAATIEDREKLISKKILIKAKAEQNRQEKQFNDTYSILQLGDIAFVFQGHELYTGFGHEINYCSPFTQTFVCQCTSKGLGEYLTTQEALDDYDFFAQPYNTIGADGAKKFVQDIVATLRDMRRNDIDRKSIEVTTEREVVTDNIQFRTFSDSADSNIIMNANGSYTVTGKSIKYKLYDYKEDLVDAVYLEAGCYAVYGCEVEVINAENNQIETYSGQSARVIPSWTKFELTQPGILTRTTVSVGSTKVTDAVTAPIVIKIDSMEEALPTVDLSGNVIALQEVE